MCPDPKKVDDMQAIKPTMNIVKLQHTLGMVIYMAPFIPKLPEQIADLCDLLKKTRCLYGQKPWKGFSTDQNPHKRGNYTSIFRPNHANNHTSRSIREKPGGRTWTGSQDGRIYMQIPNTGCVCKYRTWNASGNILMQKFSHLQVWKTFHLGDRLQASRSDEPKNMAIGNTQTTKNSIQGYLV